METTSFPLSNNRSKVQPNNLQKSQNQFEIITKKNEKDKGISSSKISNTSFTKEKSSSSIFPAKKKKKEAKKTHEKDDEVISNDSDEIREVIDDNKQDNGDVLVEIDQDKNSSLPPEKEKKYKKKEKSDKSDKKENLNFKGYSAFSFYEKEKFKEHNNKEIKQRDFVKKISLEWKKMSEAEKEPYIQLFLDFKKNNNFPDQSKLIKKKRKRATSPSCGDCVRDKKGHFSAINHEIKKTSLSIEKKFDNFNRESKNNKIDKSKENYGGIANEYLRSVVVPLVKISYEFFKDKGAIDAQ